MATDENPYAPPRADDRVIAVAARAFILPRIVRAIQLLLIAAVVLLFVGSLIHFVATLSWTSLVVGVLLGFFLVQWHRGQWTTARATGAQLEGEETSSMTTPSPWMQNGQPRKFRSFR